MSAILTTVFSLLSGLGGSLGDYFKTKQEIERLKLETQKELELANKKLAGEIAKSEFEKSKEVLKSTGQYFKYFTFFMWFGPFIIGVVNPTWSADIFNNLATMPEWYVQSCMLIMFTVWGITVSAPVVGGIFTGLGHYFADRRQYKLEKARIDRKAFYDAMRKLKGVVSSKDVDVHEKIFDQLEKE